MTTSAKKTYPAIIIPSWFPYAAGIFVFAVFIWLADSIRSENDKEYSERVNLISANLTLQIEQELTRYVNMFRRMAHRFEIHKKLTEDKWSAEALMHISTYPGTETYAWIDTSLTVRWGESINDKTPLIRNITFNPAWRSAMEKAIETQNDVVAIIEDEELKLLILIPTYEENKFIGITLGLIDIRTVLENGLPKGRSGLSLLYKDKEIYSRGEYPEASLWVKETNLLFHGLPFTIKVWPTKEMISQVSTQASSKTVGFGFILAMATMFLVMTLKRNILYSHALRNANQLLEREISENLEIRIEHKTIMDANPDIIYVCDLRGYTLQWNKRLEEVTGLTPDEIKARHATAFFAAEDWGKVAHAMQNVLETGWGEMEANMIGKDGVLIPYHHNGVPLKNKNGEIIGFTGSGRDITERKRIEAEIHKYTAELMQTNREKDVLIKKLQKLKDRLEVFAKIDPLTGLMNRRGIEHEIEQEKFRSDRSKKTFSIILADIDHFKKINDSHGHNAGDHILTEFSRILLEALRKQDIACRWGGEEFLILLPDTDASGGALLAEKLRAKVESMEIYYETHRIRVTSSFGVSDYGETPGDTQSCIKQADEYLYRAKTTGRNKVVANFPVPRRHSPAKGEN